MKKQIITIACAALMLSTGSCKKNTPIEESLITDKPSRTDTIVYRPCTLTDMELLTFDEDIDYERVDMARFVLGRAIKEYMTDDVAEFIYTNVQNSEYNSIALQEVFDTYPSLLTNVNTYLENNPIANLPYSFTSYIEVKNALHKDGIDYEIELFIPKLEDGAALSGMPILSPGVEVQFESASGSDQVVAWITTEDDASKPYILLDEAEATGSAKPVVVLSMFNQGKRNGNWAAVARTTNHNPFLWGNQTDQWIAIDRIKIYKRFEKSANSDIYFSGLLTDNDDLYSDASHWRPIPINALNYGYSKVHQKQMRKVHKNNIAQWVSGNSTTHFPLCPFLPSPWNINPDLGVETSFLWNVFEQDWWEGYKAVGYGSLNSGAHRPLGEMTFYNETYIYAPSSCNRSATWCIDEHSSATVWNANGSPVFATGHYEAEFELKRITK